MNTVLRRVRAATEPFARLRKKNGYSLAESLLALLIILLLSSGIAGGVAFASKQYNDSMKRSEAKVLCSTLTNVLRSELSIVKLISGDELNGHVTGFHPRTAAYLPDGGGTETDGPKCSELYTSDSGEIMLDEIPLLPSAAYSSYRLRATADVSFDGNAFNVELKIFEANGGKLEDVEITVMPLNSVEWEETGA